MFSGISPEFFFFQQMSVGTFIKSFHRSQFCYKNRSLLRGPDCYVKTQTCTMSSWVLFRFTEGSHWVQWGLAQSVGIGQQPECIKFQTLRLKGLHWPAVVRTRRDAAEIYSPVIQHWVFVLFFEEMHSASPCNPGYVFQNTFTFCLNFRGLAPCLLGYQLSSDTKQEMMDPTRRSQSRWRDTSQLSSATFPPWFSGAWAQDSVTPKDCKTLNI